MNMKITTCLSILFLFSISTFAQNKQVNIFCQMQYNGVIHYPKNLEKVLPDSIRKTVMIDPRKDYELKNSDDVLLLMGADGWDISSVNDRTRMYTLCRKITLDETAWELYTEKIKSLEEKVK